MLKFSLLNKIYYCEHGVLGDENACTKPHYGFATLWEKQYVLFPVWHWRRSVSAPMADTEYEQEDDAPPF